MLRETIKIPKQKGQRQKGQNVLYPAQIQTELQLEEVCKRQIYKGVPYKQRQLPVSGHPHGQKAEDEQSKISQKKASFLNYQDG